jgi:DNA repair exonuclease SbcCD nuclease subunit
MALEPLIQVAEMGIPVFLVPGNHERGKIPLHLWARHSNLHIFDQPKTFTHTVSGQRITFSGFPYRRNISSAFRKELEMTRYTEMDADIRFLCIHQAVEGAQVGVQDYTFRSGSEVINGANIPGDFAALLTGHIHRAQILTQTLNGESLATPVIYPGSIERTSLVERDEVKKYVILDIGSAGIINTRFIPLKTRPMVNLVYDVKNPDRRIVTSHLKHALQNIDKNAVVRIQLKGRAAPLLSTYLSSGLLRQIAPPTMNISLGSKPIKDLQNTF